MTAPLLYVAEGDPETWNSFSGCSRALVIGLRGHGREVRTADADLYGPIDYVAKALAFHPSKPRWIQRYQTGAVGFALKSRNARRAVAALPAGAPVLQAGATFLSVDDDDRPLYTICDANGAFAAAAGSYGALSRLSDGEIRGILEREQEVYDRCRYVFAFSQGLKDSFVRDFRLSPDKVVVTLAGPNLHVEPTDDEVAQKRSDVPTILFIGRQWERKGGPTLVAAFEKVRRAIPTARLRIAGIEPPIPPTPGIDVLGLVRRDDPGPNGLKSLYLTSDVYCMPSRYEPFGMTYSEAALHGLPCVGPRRWMSEVIADGETGYLLGHDDADELAEILISLLEDPRRAREMGAAGRRRVKALFNWRRTAGIVLEHMGLGAPSDAPPRAVTEAVAR
jgi:starch synthase